MLNPLRREAVHALEAARAAGFVRWPPGQAVEPPVPYPEDTLELPGQCVQPGGARVLCTATASR